MPVKREMPVRRDDLLQTAINETLAPEPGEGEVLLEIEAFVLTANTVTYAVVGDAYALRASSPGGCGESG